MVWPKSGLAVKAAAVPTERVYVKREASLSDSNSRD